MDESFLACSYQCENSIPWIYIVIWKKSFLATAKWFSGMYVQWKIFYCCQYFRIFHERSFMRRVQTASGRILYWEFTYWCEFEAFVEINNLATDCKGLNSLWTECRIKWKIAFCSLFVHSKECMESSPDHITE